MTAIAIVGMGVRFAGAPDLTAYWSMLREGRHAFGPVPADRWDAAMFRAATARDMDRVTAPNGAFLDDVRSFPALALGIPPRRVEVMDPQQRMALELAVQAVEDAGMRVDALPSRTGVYVGVTGHEYRLILAARISAMMMASGQFGHAPEDLGALAEAVEHVVPPRPFSAPGVLGNMAAAAVAQELDLKGPSYTLDAACASAMVALADAVSQLRSGAVDAALAGGTYLQLTPLHHVAFSRIGAMSTHGVCRPFDHRADGFVQGDGVGMILLKRLDDALRDQDRIYAVIEGVAVNSDGRGDGPMAPLLSGQEDVVRAAWEDARLDPALASHVETHGTGTPVGDPVEFQGLVNSLPGDGPVFLGSSKANVGHTMSTAGIAGLVKAALSIHHRQIPPLAGFEAPKAELALEGSRFRFNTELVDWEDEQRVTGVSSFGFGGTNGHAVLRAPEPAIAAATRTILPAASLPQRTQPELVLLSAPDLPTLRDLCARTAAALADDPTATVAGVARAWSRRRIQAARAGIVASTVLELSAALDAVAGDAELPAGTFVGESQEAPRIAFLFPGQGAQRVGMLRDLADRFPTVRARLDALEAELEGELDAPLTELIWPSEPSAEAEARLTATQNQQPAMLAAGVALADLLADLGVTPMVVTGHSLGEFAAAAVAGVLSPADAARFSARRGRAMAQLPGEHGTMAAIMADRATVEGLLVDGAVLANENHPRQVVVSGTEEAVAAVVTRAEQAELRAKPLAVSHAFHSPLLADLDAAAILGDTPLHDPAVPVASGIADRPYRDAADARDVFLRHATSPVIFTDALRQCVDAGADLFLQVGAGGPLASFARGALRGVEGIRGVYTLAPLDDTDGGAGLLATLAQLWCTGVDLDARAIAGPAPLAVLPPTVLPAESYWAIKDKKQRSIRFEGVTPRRRATEPTVEPTVVEAPPVAEASAEVDDELEGTLDVIAKVSAYPRASLKLSMKLVDDLGFDSLMVGDLATRLSERFPGLPGIPQQLLLNTPTVSDIVDFVRTGAAPDDGADDDAPLVSYRPTWVPTPRPALPAAPRPDGPTVVTGRDPDEVQAVVDALARQGVEAAAHTPVEAAESDPAWLVWVGPFEDPRPVVHVQRDDVDWPDQAEDLLAVLGAQAARGRTPDVLGLSRHDDPWAAGVAGALRAVAREWPDAVVKHLTTDDLSRAASELAEERRSADRSVDVRLVDGARAVAGFTALHGEALLPAPGEDDVVLVTGGTRGIGLAMGLRLASLGCRVLLMGRGEPSTEDAAAIAAFERVETVRADVTDLAAVRAAVAGRGVTIAVHAAGRLADGALDAVDAAAGKQARRVKVDGWLHVLEACEDTLQRVVGVGSWAGRLGNRHQAHYAAANALLASLARHAPRGVHACVGEFGPWVDSEMAHTIPAPVQAQMRAEGVDFVGREAGLDALLADLTHTTGVITHGRRLPAVVRSVHTPLTLSVETHPYLADHALEGTPVLPLAAVADLLAWAAQPSVPFEVDDVTLYAGVTVDAPTSLELVVEGQRAVLRTPDGRVHDTATIRPILGAADVPETPTDTVSAPRPLDAFYAGATFHGPLLQGIVSVEGLADGFVSGTVRAGTPADWEPGTPRTTFTVDALALDSALQLAGYAAWVRGEPAGTPVSFGRIAVLAPLPPGTACPAEVFVGAGEGDAQRLTVVIRTPDGTPALVAEDVVIERRDTSVYQPKPEDTDVSAWPEVADLQLRLDGVQALGLQNPYFHVHEGTAKNTTVVDGRELVNFSSYNYIGLSGEPRVLAAVKEAVDRYGTSVSASRVASGERPFHGELERRLAAAQGAEDALLFTAGHATNVTTIGHLMGSEDLVLHDEYIHDSALQGIKLSGAARRGFKHEDPADLERQLKDLRGSYRRCLIIVEGVYSMDGDICQLPAYVELKKRYGCLLMVDEAHSFGIVGASGCGVSEHFGIDGREIDIWMGTLSKSLASCGGWISGSKALITYLRYTAPGFVYSAGLTAANGVAALKALDLMLAEPERVKQLQDNASRFHAACNAHGLDTGPAAGESGVIPVITGNSMHALVLSERLLVEGINVQPIVYPAVPDDASRLRFFLSSTHTDEQLDRTAATVARVLAEIREEMPVP